MMEAGEFTKSTDHLDGKSALRFLRIFVEFHVAPFHGRVLVSVNSSSEDRQKRLNR